MPTAAEVVRKCMFLWGGKETKRSVTTVNFGMGWLM